MQLPEHAQKMRDELRQDASEHIAQAKQALDMINMIETKYGEALTTLADLAPTLDVTDTVSLSIANVPRTGTTTPPIQRRSAIRPDQYLGQQPLEAAKAFIADTGHAAPFDDIADAVARGGAAIKGSDWRETLERSLIRSVADVVKVQEHVFGLNRFYTPEQIVALRAARKPGGATPRGGKRRGRKKRQRRPEKKGTDTHAEATKPRRMTNGSGKPAISEMPAAE